jgi:hypothetical protein
LAVARELGIDIPAPCHPGSSAGWLWPRLMGPHAQVSEAATLKTLVYLAASASGLGRKRPGTLAGQFRVLEGHPADAKRLPQRGIGRLKEREVFFSLISTAISKTPIGGKVDVAAALVSAFPQGQLTTPVNGLLAGV